MEIDTLRIDDENDEAIALELTPDKGYCQTCGVELGDRRRKYCDEHKGAAGKLPKLSSDKRRPRAAKTAADSELADVFGKLLLIVTMAYAWSTLRRLHVSDPGGGFAEAAAMTDEEASSVAKPFARAFNSTSVGVRYGRKIVDNSDLIDAGFALYEWYKRQEQMFERLAKQLETNGNANEPSNERPPSEQSTAANASVHNESGQFTADTGYLRAVESL